MRTSLNSHLTAAMKEKKKGGERKKKKEDIYIYKRNSNATSKVGPCPREFLKSHGSSGCSRKDGTAPVKKERGGKG